MDLPKENLATALPQTVESANSSVLLDFTGSFKNDNKKAPWPLSKRLTQRANKLKEILEDESKREVETASELSKYLDDNTNGLTNNETLTSAGKMPELNAQLESLGYDTVYGSTSVPTDSNIALVFEKVLCDLQDMQRKYKSLNEDFRKMKLSAEQADKQKESLSLQLQCTKQDLANVNKKFSLFSQEEKKNKQRHEAWVKELQITISKLEGQHKQRQAAANKRETEYEKLKLKMQKLQTQRDKGLKRCMHLDRPLLPKDDPNGHLSDDECLEENLTAIEDKRVALLTKENEKLREKLAKFHLETVNRLKEASQIWQSIPELTQSGNELNQLPLTNEIVDLSGPDLCEKIDELERRTSEILEKMSSDQDKQSSYDENYYIKIMQSAKSIICEQDMLIKSLIFKDDRQGSNHSRDIQEDFEQLQKEKIMLTGLRQQIQKENDMLKENVEKLESFHHDYAKILQDKELENSDHIKTTSTL